ncbi:MAG TPA: tRNA (adenosine(37)-N6)-threonylcarbamoyltransferase complex dimerization subunit type 1 TsaB [Candidatus Acidoferrales bacterium]|jgi:tRNA threonylcarbamoyladenosine biosynthesis protein TsaB|nr:tRNA (adenosine(37)-N6)-threonylcarbamoyltransferase complex dimerization subunit type 1 TsaB [Candidatus Acidoferrales bacterium]
MKILAIDTSTQSGGAAVMEGDSVIASVFEQAHRRGQVSEMPHADEEYSSKLFRYVDLVLKKAVVSLPAVDIFAVAAGPGSFTGLRVGLAAVKAWSEVYGKPIAAISGLEAVAAQSSSSSGAIAAFGDARRGQVFGGVFLRIGGGLRRVGEDVVMSPQEFIAEVAKSVRDVELSFVSTAPEIMQEALAESALRDFAVERASEDLAPWVGRLAFGSAQRGELVDALTLDANYVRRMDAELYWKDS